MPDLERLARDLDVVDALIMDLIKRRMDIASLVGAYKMANNEKMFRPDVEDARLAAVDDHARRIGLNPNLARAILYDLIGESCKLQAVQLQSERRPDLERLEGEARRRELKENLLRLTAAIAEKYDASYTERHLATESYRRFEDDLLAAEISKLEPKALALDLGCATGAVAFRLARDFERVKGFDLSPDMLKVAERKRQAMPRASGSRVSFERVDLVEDAFPVEDGSVSLAVMNLGTASDVMDIEAVLAKIGRALAPKGRFLLSFYNADALVYKCGFVPWRVSLAAVQNPYTDCLDVQIDGASFSVYARLYAEAEVRAVMPAGLRIDRASTFPLLASILPEDFFKSLPDPTVIDAIDRGFLGAPTSAASGLGSAGAYLVVTGGKSA
ncbi:MAG TPA: methyltransferase domain-containing protein [Alphaproteobacteria bacterium]|nr:methyltransferase domain-containing protein [Alphaproteobacteria bacterium]